MNYSSLFSVRYSPNRASKLGHPTFYSYRLIRLKRSRLDWPILRTANHISDERSHPNQALEMSPRRMHCRLQRNGQQVIFNDLPNRDQHEPLIISFPMDLLTVATLAE